MLLRWNYVDYDGSGSSNGENRKSENLLKSCRERYCRMKVWWISGKFCCEGRNWLELARSFVQCLAFDISEFEPLGCLFSSNTFYRELFTMVFKELSAMISVSNFGYAKYFDIPLFLKYTLWREVFLALSKFVHHVKIRVCRTWQNEELQSHIDEAERRIRQLDSIRNELVRRCRRL